ncbi:MAG: hypothetical protein HFJ66_01355 [Eggerthellaceae bacterium]|nr:hypothetical protein [Eggerthellaceae bacterium]
MAVKVVRGVFLCAFLCFICSIAAVKAVTLFGHADIFPSEWAVGAKNSTLEGRVFQAFPKLSRATVEDGTFQSQFEQYLSDLTPAREEVVLANAAMQRSAIRASAHLLGVSAYPTYFGASMLIDEGRQVVCPMPANKEGYKPNLITSVEILNEFAADRSEIPVAFFLSHCRGFSQHNPAYSLVSDAVDEEFTESTFLKGLNNGIVPLSEVYSSDEEFDDAFFRTDHHWKMSGAYDAYREIIAALRPDDEPVEITGHLEWRDIPFYGSSARTGLCPDAEPDYIVDYCYDESPVEVEIGETVGGLELVRHRDVYDNFEQRKHKYVARYAEFFHGTLPLLIYRNPEAQSDERLLIVGDSFCGGVDRYFSEHYKEVYVIDPRMTDITIDDALSQNPVDQILFISSGWNFCSSAFREFMGAE